MQLTLISLYIKPQTKITIQQWIQFFNKLPKPCLITGDFNAHHRSWGCDFEDLYGKNLLEAMDQCNLVYLNDGTPTLVNYTGSSKSAIDLTLCNPEIHHLFSWCVLDDPHGSDHLPILINCEIYASEHSTRSHKIWRTEKADWNSYKENLERCIAETNYERFVENINMAAQASIPKIHYSTNKRKQRNFKPWWNDTCDQAVKTRKEAYNDICIYTQKKTFAQCTSELTKIMEKVHTWTQQNGLNISLNKSATCVFNRKRIQYPATIKLGPYNLVNKNTVKYLGLFLDRKLLWKDHIQHVIKKNRELNQHHKVHGELTQT
ncbi:hypothetical protein NQ315_014723 [Exocentrus adspersus]|uniref:Endonuclease/exonuclease/phosphatase domain-containing protein n=1 Tax=Exocentrus adspersus TaxID=1586481 RepID=A0AAV8VET0_9CUCU|nr:hypothetical protein NQ315_014723 [Exocentrus adspersus]